MARPASACWRRRSPSSRRPDRRAAPFVLAALFAIGLALQLQLGARLQSDGFYYFAYLRSMAFDRDVNFMNDYRMLGLGDKTYLFQPTPTGHAQSAWTIGPAIVWAPFFAAGHVVATRLHAERRGRQHATARRFRIARRSASRACSTACSAAGSCYRLDRRILLAADRWRRRSRSPSRARSCSGIW